LFVQVLPVPLRFSGTDVQAAALWGTTGVVGAIFLVQVRILAGFISPCKWDFRLITLRLCMSQLRTPTAGRSCPKKLWVFAFCRRDVSCVCSHSAQSRRLWASQSLLQRRQRKANTVNEDNVRIRGRLCPQFAEGPLHHNKFPKWWSR
jgi:hypothetical protein